MARVRVSSVCRVAMLPHVTAMARVSMLLGRRFVDATRDGLVRLVISVPPIIIPKQTTPTQQTTVFFFASRKRRAITTLVP